MTTALHTGVHSLLMIVEPGKDVGDILQIPGYDPTCNIQSAGQWGGRLG